jgi:glucokinase
LPHFQPSSQRPLPQLVADVGGSNARFGWLAPGDTRASYVERLPVANYPGVVAAATDYLHRLSQRLGSHYCAPTRAAIAVATAVTGDTIDFTNSTWSFSQAQARTALGLETLLVLNDFEALALALPWLDASQVRRHEDKHGIAFGQGAPRSAMAVIGPGTGLGVAGVLPTANGWLAIPGEGGHASLAAGNAHEAALLAIVHRQHEHVSAERLLSGIGLPLLHSAMAELAGSHSAEPLDAQTIVERGLAGDLPCRNTLLQFCALLGSFAGNVALTLGARGGVYIGGGIVPRLGDLFFESDFRQRFEAKGRLASYLRAIPTALITDTLVGLTGAAAALE